MIKKVLNILISFCLFIQFPLMAEIPTVEGPNTQRFSGSEYYVGKDLGIPLISIKLLNGVQKPGVYHVPRGTDLGELISYAGGSNLNANLDEILVKRNHLGKIKNYEVDLEKILSSTSSIPKLADHDVVYIDTDVKLDQTLRWVSIVSGFLTIALTTILIIDRAEDD